tara:strand:- start:128 stop:361 length:234 start_codon:yes stop_codon:yes gene_type:complete
VRGQAPTAATAAPHRAHTHNLYSFTRRWVYLYRSPDYWWQTELWYIALSLTAKLFLGGFLYSNVLRFASITEALAQD